MPDLELRCVQCQSNFVFSENDQETFYRRNLPQPQRCDKCRPTRKKLVAAATREKAGADNTGVKNRYEIVCDNCGKKDFVPFAPKTGRAILCGHCHAASRARTRFA